MKWLDIEEIVELLEENYPELDIISLRFTKLHKMIINLKNFSDDPNKSNEKILEKIQSEWIIYRNDSKN